MWFLCGLYVFIFICIASNVDCPSIIIIFKTGMIFFDFFGIVVSLFWFLNELCGTKSTYCYLQKYLYTHKYTLLLLKYYKSVYNYTF